jgi:hypothetical protein
MTTFGRTLTSVGTNPVGVLGLAEVPSKVSSSDEQLHNNLFGFAGIEGR